MIRSAVAPVIAMLFAVQVEATAVGERVDDFRLLDHRGDSHGLYYYSDARAVVLLAHAGGCASDALAGLGRSAALPAGVVAFGLDVSGSTDRVTLEHAVTAAGVDVPVLMDESRLVAESLGITRADEALVIDPKSWMLVYRGPASGIAAALSGGAARTVNRLDAAPCPVVFPPEPVASYSETIAPLLIERCVSCHRPGGIGPWAMTSYEMVRGFSPMMREVVRTQRMPPWHADPHFGTFKGDRSLPVDERRTLIRWIEAGAPRGTGADPLAALDRDWPEWSLGEPDFIVTLPPFEVPATGVVDYQFPTVTNTLDRDVWVRAVDVLPGDRRVVHHVIASFTRPNEAAQIGRLQGSLGGYVPGAGPTVYPDATGVLLPKGATFVLQMHYTTFGKATTDRTRMGLYVTDEPPVYPLRATVLMDPTLRIPPNTKAHSVSVSRVLERDIILYSMLPHAHYRGRESEFTAQYPDGRTEVLLSVPRYDFNWQHTYELATPKPLPAGTRLVHTTTWDNSAQNPANPDPDREVPWGEQSWDEMIYGAVRFRYAEETVAQPFSDQQVRREMMFAQLDTDRDGRLTAAEIAARFGPGVARRIADFDADGNGGLDISEAVSLTQAMRGQGRRDGRGEGAAAPARVAMP